MDSSANLKRARMRAGLSGAELARRLKMERGTWGRIERGQRKLPFELARRVAEILECSVDDLITGENVGGEGLMKVPETPIAIASTDAPKVDLPVFGTSDLSTKRVKMERTGNFVQRPFIVAENDKAYAMHVFNEDAAPRYEVGDIIIVDPVRPAKPHQWVVVTIPHDDEITAEIWRFIGVNGDTVVLSRNDQSMTLGPDSVVSVDLIVGIQLA